MHAYNGFECLEITEKERPDIILMDFHMPDIDGTEVTRRLKKSFSTASIPILGVSADAFKSSKLLALESGMVGYITKPIDFNLLFSLMANYLPKQKESLKIDEQESVELSSSIKDELTSQLNKIAGYEIYETEKLMSIVAQLEEIANDSSSSALRKNIFSIKEAVLLGQEKKLKKVISTIKKLVN